jgi:hypothetical protein
MEGPRQPRDTMTTTLLLRIASAISLLFTAGHTLGGRKQWSPNGDNEVLRAMTSVHFDMMGVNRSYLDFFMGFGWTLSVFMLMETVLIWQLANLSQTNIEAARPMIVVIAVATLAMGLLSWRFLFPVPALFSIVLFVVLVAAYVIAK